MRWPCVLHIPLQSKSLIGNGITQASDGQPTDMIPTMTLHTQVRTYLTEGAAWTYCTMTTFPSEFPLEEHLDWCISLGQLVPHWCAKFPVHQMLWITQQSWLTTIWHWYNRIILTSIPHLALMGHSYQCSTQGWPSLEQNWEKQLKKRSIQFWWQLWRHWMQQMSFCW